jgi:hypothetical protein
LVILLVGIGVVILPGCVIVGVGVSVGLISSGEKIGVGDDFIGVGVYVYDGLGSVGVI